MAKREAWRNGVRIVTAGTRIWHPACRTVVLWVWLEEGTLRHEAEPVLAMEARTVSYSHSEEDWTEVQHYPITTESLPHACDDDHLESFTATLIRTVACTWPPERDEVEFARIAESLRGEATRKAKCKTT